MTKVKLLHAVCTLALLSAVPSMAQTPSQNGGMNGGAAAEKTENPPAAVENTQEHEPATENMKEHEPSAESTQEHEPSSENMKEHEPSSENMKEHESEEQMKENGATKEEKGTESRIEPRKMHKITRMHARQHQADTSQNEAVDRLNQQSLDAARNGQPFTGSPTQASPPAGAAGAGSMK